MKRCTTSTLQKKKRNGEKITVLTAYDYPFARLADEAGIDCLLVSDVLGQVALGYESTVPVTLQDIAYHTKAVRRAVKNALVIAKMPFLSTAGSDQELISSASVLIKDAGAQALEIEGGSEIVPKVRLLVQAGIPVMPHIGLTAQHFFKTGSFKVQGSTPEEAKVLLDLSVSLQEAGVFAVMLECVPAELGEVMSARLDVPVIGIGSGPRCDGQILVPQDMLGLFEQFVPKFVKVYKNLSEEIQQVFTDFRTDVLKGTFPAEEHTYHLKETDSAAFRDLVGDDKKEV